MVIAKHKQMEQPAAKVLGQKVTYPQHYDASVLEAIPRQWNRDYLNISDAQLPFVGADIWHAYELSFLTKKGLPVVGVLKLLVPADSAEIVESKSLKLYLNSFNMTTFGNSVKEGVVEVKALIHDDLSRLLHAEIQLGFIEKPTGIASFDSDYELLEKSMPVDDLNIEVYNEDESLLEHVAGGQLRVKSELLRSNCKVTNQPDWGDVFIYMKGEQLPSQASLLKYIISFRNEQHFHEEICEAIYERLSRLFSPVELMVACLYTRRGGIDICPVRASSIELLSMPLLDVDVLSDKMLRC